MEIARIDISRSPANSTSNPSVSTATGAWDAITLSLNAQARRGYAKSDPPRMIAPDP
jgi:hypothetical protein